MSYTLLIILLTIFYLIGSVIIFYFLNKWIDQGKTGDRPYTRLTMGMMLVSFVGTLLMATTVVMNGFLLEDTKDAMIAQAEGIAPLSPRLEVESNLESVGILPSYFVVGLEKKDWEKVIIPSYYHVGFIVQNKGQGKTNAVSFTLTDTKGAFFVNSPTEFFDPLETKLVYIEYWSENCSGGGLEDYEAALERCKSDMLEGIHNWNLNVSCWACKPEKLKCYTFSTCIYATEEGQEYCKEEYNQEEYGFKEIEC